MLHLLLGRAGSGKTQTIRSLLAHRAAAGEKNLLLLVPEQFSFESERAMLDLAGVAAAQHIEVLSFSRLAHTVLQAHGAMQAPRLDDSGRRMLMTLAMRASVDQLQVYRRHAGSQQLCQLLIEADTELKTCAIPARALLEKSAALPDLSLRRKVQEIALLCSAYEALAAQSYMDPLDDLTKLAALARTEKIFSEKTVAIDAFSGFSQQEFAVIACMLAQTKEVYITLCCDTLDRLGGRPDIFTLVRRTGNQLIALAKENRVAVAPIVYLDEPKRFENDELRHLEASLFADEVSPADTLPQAVHLLHLPGIYEETDCVAALIRELVLQKGYRYGDFSVVCRSASTYAAALKAAFAKRDIPCFADSPRPLNTEPLVRFLLAAFGAAALRTEDIFTMLKTGLAGFTQEELSLLENYVYIWRIDGKTWLSAFTQNPDGATGKKPTPEALQCLAEINALRERIVSPLVRFSAAIANADGTAVARALYTLLTDLHADENTTRLCADLRAQENLPLAQEQMRIWNLLMEILDQCAAVLKEQYLPPEGFRDLLEAAISAREIATIPQGMNEVIFGTADRMRQAEPKVVFILGAAEGDFPLSLAENGIYTLEERKKLIDAGIPVHDFEESGIIGEKYMAYTALCSASQQLFVLWPDKAGGAEKTPGECVWALQRSFPQISVADSLPPEIACNAEQAAFSAVAAHFTENSVQAETLRTLFREKPAYTGKYAALENAAHRRPFALLDKNVTEQLQKNKVFSATQIETFHHCRFQYFCRYQIGAKERLPATLDMAQYGSLVHYLLEHLLQGDLQAYAALSAKEKEAQMRGMITDYAQLTFGGLSQLSSREQYRFFRMADAVQVVLDHAVEELLQNAFRPVFFELQLGTNGVRPLHISTPHTESTVGGTIDRVDIFAKDGQTFVRVVDYKTGKKEFRLSEIVYGVNLQMLLYLAAVTESLAYTPAGILYMPAARPVVPALESDSREDIAKAVEKKLKMNGLLTDDPTVLHAMEQQLAGKYIPTEQKSSGEADRKNLVSLPEMQHILHFVRATVGAMAERLWQGDIDADPLLIGKNACTYCPYSGVCGRELQSLRPHTAGTDTRKAMAEIEEKLQEGATE